MNYNKILHGINANKQELKITTLQKCTNMFLVLIKYKKNTIYKKKKKKLVFLVHFNSIIYDLSKGKLKYISTQSYMIYQKET